MNHIYRIVWNQVLNAWVAVAESARGRGKGASRKLVAAALSLTAGLAVAAPLGGQVVAGAGNITQVGITTNITQASQNLSLNWQSFNIASHETVNFVQPSASAIAVNRIFDTNGSQILGGLNANGQVYLINPNGILFGQGAQVNVGGLVASTLDLNAPGVGTNSRSFSGTGAGSIVNLGTINATSGGYVALLGNTVSNQGTITAALGTVALGAGNAVTLNFNGNRLVKMQIDQSLLNSLAENGGLIQADGGLVVMSAGAKDALLASVVNNSGTIEARTVEDHEGTISLLGGMEAGTVNVGGTLDASAPSAGNGGTIETSAAIVNVANTSRVSTLATAGTTGQWLIDPIDFTISAGGASQTTSGIGAATLASSLNTTNVTIQTDTSTGGNGDIFVNDSITKTSAAVTSLTLQAHGDIVLATGVGIVSTGGALNVTLNSDSGASSAGAIRLYDNASIVTAGGNIVMGGGSNPLTTAAFSSSNGNGNGIELDAGVHLNAGTGSISMRGQGNDAASYSDGVRIAGAGTSVVGGNITIVGQGSNQGGSVSRGVDLENGATVTGSGVVTVTGTGGATAGNSNIGVALYGASTAIAATGTGTLTVTGVGGGTGSSSNNYGVYAESGAQFTSNTGALSITGTAGNASVTPAVGVNIGSVSGSGDVSIADLTGDLNIVSALSWGANSTLSLGAWRNININQALAATGSNGKLVLQYGQGASDGVFGGVAAAYNVNAQVNLQAGLNFSTQLGSTGVVKNFTVITSLGTAGSTTGADLQGMSTNLNGNYVLGSNIDATTTASWNAGAGFAPIGNSASGFAGTFDGLGHSITGLSINHPASTAVGLFGQALSGAAIRNVGLENATVTGLAQVGGLVGYNSGTISNSYAVSTTTGTNGTGGLVGNNNSGTVINSYASGIVNGNNDTGGLVGYSFRGTVSNSYALASVSGITNVGGLVGHNEVITTVTNSYAAGSVAGTTYVGGLVGYNGGTLSNSHWNSDVKATGVGGGTTTGTNVSGLTTVQMQTASNFTGFNFTSTPGATGNNWVMVDADGSLNNAGSSLGSTLPMLASEHVTTINTAHQLQLVAMDLTATYTLAKNIDASATASGKDVWGSAGFVPIVSTQTVVDTSGRCQMNPASCMAPYQASIPFTGNFDGLSHSINNLTELNALAYAGLFGQIGTAGSVENLGLRAVAITKLGYGNSNYLIPFGALAGTNDGRISNVYSTGTIINSGPDYNAFGGLVGNNTGVISNAYASVALSSGMWGTSVGGLVGTNSGTISSSYAAGAVTGNGRYVNVGGLVGQNTAGSIDNSYASGAVNSGGTPNTNNIGGLIGLMSGGAIASTYAAVPITATKYGADYGSGLIGSTSGGSVSDSFWDTTISNRTTGIGYPWDSQSGVTGLTSTQMMQMASFSSWNTVTPNSIANSGSSGAVWRIYEGQTAPLLISFMTGLTLSDVSATYSGTQQTGTTTALSGVSGLAAQGTNVGTYLNSYYSTQQGYDISGGNLTINAVALSAISLSGTRAYDGTADVAANIFTLSGLVNGQDLVLSGVGTIASKNVGTYSVNLGSLALGNGNTGLASNYTFTGGTQNATITAAALSVTASAVTKMYDGTLSATGLGTVGTVAGASAGESVLSSGSQTFLDKNAGTGNKTVRASGVTIKDVSGADVSSNYAIIYTDNTTSTISKANLTVSGLTATDKVYDASTSATLSGTATVVALASDVVTLAGTASATFADKNAASNKAVTVSGVTLGTSTVNNDNANYNLVQQTGLTATISKAPLVYQAAPSSFLNGQSPTHLSGTVNGFVSGDTVGNATSGQLAWSTSANADSKPGAYAIDGMGLAASNYSFSQAASNATALTLEPGTPPVQVRDTTAQLASTTASAQASSKPVALSMSPAITVTETTTVETGSPGAGSTSKQDNVAAVNTSLRIGATGPNLQIVNGGMRLPLAMVNVNE